MSRPPSLRDLADVVRHIQRQVPVADPDFIREGDSAPSIDLTIGWDPDKVGWSWQSGDNSYTGGAYGFPIWAVTSVYRRSNSRELARELQSQLLDQTV